MKTEVFGQSISMSPNPVDGYFSVYGKNATYARVHVYAIKLNS